METTYYAEGIGRSVEYHDSDEVFYEGEFAMGEERGLNVRYGSDRRTRARGLPAASKVWRLLDQVFTAAAPNTRRGGGKLYLAVMLDLSSRFIVGWALSAVNDGKLTLKALEMALKRCCPKAGLLQHTDRGGPYTCEDYQDLLEEHGITVSMSRTGNCYDNAAMESWFSTLKAELGERFESPNKAKHELFDFIEIFYNQERTHSTLGYLSPAEYEAKAKNDQEAA